MLKFLSLISVNYEVTLDANSIVGNSISFTYGGKVTSGVLTLYTPYQWMNVNLRVQFGSYITLSVW